jgi:hypothetical protein
VVRALLVVLIATSVASAHPVIRDDVMLVDQNPVIVVPPPPPPPADKLHTRLGLRTGVGKLPIGHLEVVAVGLLQLTADIEIAHRTRTFAEYELLLLSAHETPMSESLSGIGHRGSLGLMRELLAKRPRDRVALFTVLGEIGGGATLASGEVAARAIPHGLVGLRFGFSLHLNRDQNPEPSFGFELLVRALVVPEGAGLTMGIGMQWGE